MKKRSFLRALRPELIAIEVAVSTLSPVNIQIYMPADFRSSIVRCTFSYNLSSTPVTPKNSKSLSSSLTTLLMACSLCFNFYLASLSFSRNLFVCYSVKTFCANTNVRRPSIARFSQNSSRDARAYGLILCSITTSAPLT